MTTIRTSRRSEGSEARPLNEPNLVELLLLVKMAIWILLLEFGSPRTLQ